MQGEVFFCRPGHMLAPSKNFCGDLYPRILFPHAFSHLLPSPPLGDPGSGMFMHSDPCPPENTGWCLGSGQGNHSTLSPAPHPPMLQQSMFVPHGTSQMKHVLLGRPCLPQMTDTDSLPGGWEEIRASLCCLGICFPMGPGHISLSGNMFLHVDVCFPMQRVLFSPASSLHPPGLRPST